MKTEDYIIRCLECGKQWFHLKKDNSDIICDCDFLTPDTIVPKGIAFTVKEEKV
jgi:hypothetical protein